MGAVADSEKNVLQPGQHIFNSFSSACTIRFNRMADPLSVAGLSLGVVSAVIQTYGAVMQAYDVYLGVKDFANEYQDIRMGLLIEKARLELWGSLVLFDGSPDERSLSQRDMAFWGLFELIFNSIVTALQESHRTMEKFGQQTGVPTQQNLSGEPWSTSSIQSDSPK